MFLKGLSEEENRPPDKKKQRVQPLVGRFHDLRLHDDIPDG